MPRQGTEEREFCDPQEKGAILLELFRLLAGLDDGTLSSARRGLTLPNGQAEFAEFIRQLYRLEPELRRDLLDELKAEQAFIMHPAG